ncbi:MAG: rod shape-determining protein MreC, partial [Planctomycetota bacterium]
MRIAAERPHRAFPIALAITVVLAFLPDAVLKRLQDVSDIVNFGLTPVREGINLTAAWLRPPEQLVDDELTNASVEQLAVEMQTWRQKYQAALLQVRLLEDRVTELQALEAHAFDIEVQPLEARISGRDPRGWEGAIELNRGAGQGVREGTVAVREGIFLVGRVVDVSPVRSVLMPITHEGIGLLEARVISDDEDAESIVDAPLIQLRPMGKGLFVGDAPKGVGIGVN